MRVPVISFRHARIADTKKPQERKRHCGFSLTHELLFAVRRHVINGGLHRADFLSLFIGDFSFEFFF